MVKTTVFKENLFTLSQYLVLQYFNYAGIEIHQTLIFDAGEDCDDR